jgi:hypothetical protein
MAVHTGAAGDEPAFDLGQGGRDRRVVWPEQVPRGGRGQQAGVDAAVVVIEPLDELTLAAAAGDARAAELGCGREHCRGHGRRWIIRCGLFGGRAD